MNYPQQKQSSNHLHDPKCQIMTYASETTINRRSPRHFHSQSEEGSEYFFGKKPLPQIKRDQEYIYRLKMKIMNTYRLIIGEQSYPQVQDSSIEDIILKLHKSLKHKINEYEKAIRENQKQIKLLEIDKMNLQTQIQVHSVDVMRITSKNNKNLKIISSDRQKYIKKITQKDIELQNAEKKIIQFQMLSRQQNKIINELNGKINSLKKELEEQNSEYFEKEKDFLKSFSSERSKVTQITKENQNLKESLIRNCQQKNDLTQKNQKLERNYQKEKEKHRKADCQRHQLEIESNELMSRVQKMAAQNIYLIDLLKKEKDYSEELNQRFSLIFKENEKKIVFLEKEISIKIREVAQQRTKISASIKVFEDRENKWKKVIETYESMLSSLQKHFEEEKYLLIEEIKVCEELGKSSKKCSCSEENA